MSHWYVFSVILSHADPLLLGNRYIELFLKSTECKPPQGIGPNGQYLFMLQMRGLPFKVTGKDIYKVNSIDITIRYNLYRRMPPRKIQATDVIERKILNRYLLLACEGIFYAFVHYVIKNYVLVQTTYFQFFSPIPILAWSLEMGMNGPNGSARIAFHTQDDLKAAFSKDKEYIGERYVELLPCKPFNKRKPNA